MVDEKTKGSISQSIFFFFFFNRTPFLVSNTKYTCQSLKRHVIFFFNFLSKTLLHLIIIISNNNNNNSKKKKQKEFESLTHKVWRTRPWIALYYSVIVISKKDEGRREKKEKPEYSFVFVEIFYCFPHTHTSKVSFEYILSCFARLFCLIE